MPRLYRNRHDAYRVYMRYAFVQDFALTMAFTIFMVYLVRLLELDPFHMVLVGTALEAAAFLFEIPTGVVADVYSRRLSVVIGLLLLGAGFIIFGLTTVFGVILASQVIAGIGFTFISGAATAWLSDEIGEAPANRALLRGAQVGTVGSIAGIVVGVALALWNLALPIVLAGVILLLLALYLTLFMPEQGFQPRPREERETFGAMMQTVRDGGAMIRRRPVLITILAVSLLVGAFSEGYDRLWTLHILENYSLPAIGDLDSVVWFGIIGIVSALIGIVLTEYIRRRTDTHSHEAVARALMRITGLLMVMIIVFALAGDFVLALLAFWAIGALRGVSQPLETAWINQRLDPQVRATVLSISAQTNALGQIAGGPGVGYIGRLFGVRAALIAASLILTPALALYARTLRLGDSTQPAEVPAA
jgi:MFS transporter, DHA3 family, tetracycline resistance protein